MKPLLLLASLLLVTGLAACAISKPADSSNSRHDPAIHLSATLISPTDIELNWHDPDANTAGHVVEYANDPNGDYVPLDFLPPSQTTFKHPNLIPQTQFCYRVRALHGPASAPIEITLPQSLSDKDYAARYGAAEDYSWAPPKTVVTDVPTAKNSIRNPATAPTAVPTDLHATLMPVTVSGFKLTWTDRASDNDGFLLEILPEGTREFQICALLAPNINSFGWGLAPPTRKASFRLRPFYYGPSSNIASAITGLKQSHP